MSISTQTILDNAVAANASYGDLNKYLTAKQYIEALTDNGIGKPGMSLDQAKAFAGITEKIDENGKKIGVR